jgi:hypothetical protein
MVPVSEFNVVLMVPVSEFNVVLMVPVSEFNNGERLSVKHPDTCAWLGSDVKHPDACAWLVGSQSKDSKPAVGKRVKISLFLMDTPPL